MLIQIYDMNGEQIGLYGTIKGNGKTEEELQEDINNFSDYDKNNNLEATLEAIGLERVFVDAELLV